MSKYRCVYFKFDFEFFKHFVCLGFFIIFCFFFMVNSGGFLHNRVATLVKRDLLLHETRACELSNLLSSVSEWTESCEYLTCGNFYNDFIAAHEVKRLKPKLWPVSNFSSSILESLFGNISHKNHSLLFISTLRSHLVKCRWAFIKIVQHSASIQKLCWDSLAIFLPL